MLPAERTTAKTIKQSKVYDQYIFPYAKLENFNKHRKLGKVL